MKLTATQRRWVRRLVLAGMVLAVLILVNYTFREPRYAIMGWLRGESFFEGKPTSLWREEVREYAAARTSPRPPSILKQYLPFFLTSSGSEPPRILTANSNTLPVLIELLGDPDRWVRREVCLRITQMGSSARPAFPALVEMLNDKDPLVRQDAAYCMRYIDANQTEVVLLEKALKHPESVTPTEVVWWLSGPAAQNEEAFAALCEMTRHPDKDVRRSAMYTVADIARDRAWPLLLEWIRSPDKERRKQAIPFTVYQGGPGSPGWNPVGGDRFPTHEDIPILVGWLGDEDEEWREQTIKWLGALGPEAKEAVPALLRIVEDEKDPAYPDAWLALNEIDQDAARKLLPAGK